MPRRRLAPLIALLMAGALCSIALALKAGDISAGWGQVWVALLPGGDSALSAIIRELRLPRALAAFACGGLLATAGALMQVLLRNPLADPYILGISGGAAVAALGAITLGAASFWVDASAFVGAITAMVVVFGLAHGDGSWTQTRLLLTGVIVAAGCGAAVSLMLALAPDTRVMHAGIIMNIRSVDSRGFFKGDFDYAETESYTQGDQHVFGLITDGVYSFYGDFDFEIYRSKKRNPFKLKENRIYKGNLYIVDRMDFKLEDYKLEDYLIAEFSAIHYREMETIKFKLNKVHRKGSQKFPDEFVLYRSSGLNFEPYKNLKTIVFPRTRVDK